VAPSPPVLCFNQEAVWQLFLLLMELAGRRTAVTKALAAVGGERGWQQNFTWMLFRGLCECCRYGRLKGDRAKYAALKGGPALLAGSETRPERSSSRWSTAAAASFARPLLTDARHACNEAKSQGVITTLFEADTSTPQSSICPRIDSMASPETPLAKGNALLASGDHQGALAVLQEVSSSPAEVGVQREAPVSAPRAAPTVLLRRVLGGPADPLLLRRCAAATTTGALLSGYGTDLLIGRGRRHCGSAGRSPPRVHAPDGRHRAKAAVQPPPRLVLTPPPSSSDPPPSAPTHRTGPQVRPLRRPPRGVGARPHQV
jgi:hypothetical protein